MSRHEETRGQWQSLVARFERSGASLAAFATAAGISLPMFRYWLYKLRRAAAAASSMGRSTSASPATSKGSAKSAEVRLLPVRVRPDWASGQGSVEVDVASLRLRVSGHADPTYVASLVGALREIRC
jgi:hypothetical protein